MELSSPFIQPQAVSVTQPAQRIRTGYLESGHGFWEYVRKELHRLRQRVPVLQRQVRSQGLQFQRMVVQVGAAAPQTIPGTFRLLPLKALN